MKNLNSYKNHSIRQLVKNKSKETKTTFLWKNRASSAEQLMPQPDMELGCSMRSVDIQLKALKPYSILEHLFKCSMCSRTHPFLVSDHPCCVLEGQLRQKQIKIALRADPARSLFAIRAKAAAQEVCLSRRCVFPTKLTNCDWNVRWWTFKGHGD